MGAAFASPGIVSVAEAKSGFTADSNHMELGRALQSPMDSAAGRALLEADPCACKDAGAAPSPFHRCCSGEKQGSPAQLTAAVPLRLALVRYLAKDQVGKRYLAKDQVGKRYLAKDQVGMKEET